MTINRIHIIGGTGSGKTTLAHDLATVLKATAYALDLVAYENASGSKRSLSQRQMDIAHIVSTPRWITEGAFLWWVDDLLEAADVIIWLDIPWSLALWRVVTRHFKLSWAGTNRHPGLIRLLGFLRWAYRFYVDTDIKSPVSSDDDGAINRATMAHHLSPYTSKLIRCQTPAEVAALLDTLKADLRHTGPSGGL